MSRLATICLLLVQAVPVVALLLLPCATVAIGDGHFEVAVAFDPPIPEGTRVFSQLIPKMHLATFLESPSHPELRFMKPVDPANATVSVPFSTHSPACFGKTQYFQGYDTALFRLVDPDGTARLFWADLPDRHQERRIVVSTVHSE